MQQAVCDLAWWNRSVVALTVFLPMARIQLQKTKILEDGVYTWGSVGASELTKVLCSALTMLDALADIARVESRQITLR